jgi:hypothetical protein
MWVHTVSMATKKESNKRYWQGAEREEERLPKAAGLLQLCGCNSRQPANVNTPKDIHTYILLEDRMPEETLWDSSPVIYSIYFSYRHLAINDDRLSVWECLDSGGGPVELIGCHGSQYLDYVLPADILYANNLPRNGDTDDLMPPTPMPIRIKAPTSPPRPAPCCNDIGNEVRNSNKSPEI